MSKIICPDDCSDQIRVLDFNDCNPNFNSAEIYTIYLTNIGYPIVATEGDDAGIRANFNARISNTSTNPNAIRQLTVKADKPAPAANEITLSKNRKIRINKDHTINVVIDETGNDNYQFLRELECGQQFLMWWVGGKYMYGGEDNFIDGQEVSFNLDDIYSGDEKDVETFTGAITWTGKHQERMINPLV